MDDSQNKRLILAKQLGHFFSLTIHAHQAYQTYVFIRHSFQIMEYFGIKLCLYPVFLSKYFTKYRLFGNIWLRMEIRIFISKLCFQFSKSNKTGLFLSIFDRTQPNLSTTGRGQEELRMQNSIGCQHYSCFSSECNQMNN